MQWMRYHRQAMMPHRAKLWRQLLNQEILLRRTRTGDWWVVHQAASKDAGICLILLCEIS